MDDFTPETYAQLCKFVAKESGLFFDDTKETAVRNAVQERLRATGIQSFKVYLSFLMSTDPQLLQKLNNNSNEEFNSARELQRLIDNLVVNETTFFRNREHYLAIQHEVIPRLIRRNRESKTLRFWSAGCSTGQEPYSLAMMAVQSLEANHEQVGGQYGWKIEIVASDISEKALRIARAGRYRQDDVRNVDQSRLSRFFVPLHNPNAQTAPLDPAQLLGPNRVAPVRPHERYHYEVAPEIRQLISFNHLNLIRPIYPRDRYYNFDLVLCENVTIYFPPDITRRVIENVYETLNSGGWLFIGYSETLWQVSDRFKLINSHETFYYQKPFPDEELPPAYTRGRSLTGPLSAANLNAKSSQTEKLLGSHNTRSADSGKTTTDKLRQLLENASNSQPSTSSEKSVETTNFRPSNGFEVRGGLASLNTKSLNAANSDKPTTNSLRKVPPRTDPNLYKLREPQPIENKNEPKPAKTEPTKQDWEEALQQGVQMMQEHDFDSAKLYLERAQQMQPDNVDVIVAVAQLCAKLGNYDEAAALSRRAVASNPLCEDAHLLLAMIYYREGQIRESIAEFEKSIYINFDSVVAHMRLGDIYRDIGMSSNALREYRNAVKALDKKRSDEIIEDLPVELLKRTCEQNIVRLSRGSR